MTVGKTDSMPMPHATTASPWRHEEFCLTPPVNPPTRKGLQNVALFFSLSFGALRAQSPLPAQDAAPVSWQITQRDFHSETWESAVPVVDPFNGKTRFQRHKFMSIGSGMNFWDQESQSFQPTREEFSITPDGKFATALFGPIRLAVE